MKNWFELFSKVILFICKCVCGACAVGVSRGYQRRPCPRGSGGYLRRYAPRPAAPPQSPPSHELVSSYLLITTSYALLRNNSSDLTWPQQNKTKQYKTKGNYIRDWYLASPFAPPGPSEGRRRASLCPPDSSAMSRDSTLCRKRRYSLRLVFTK